MQTHTQHTINTHRDTNKKDDRHDGTQTFAWSDHLPPEKAPQQPAKEMAPKKTPRTMSCACLCQEYLCIHIYIDLHTYTNIHLHVHWYTYTHTRVHIHTHICNMYYTSSPCIHLGLSHTVGDSAIESCMSFILCTTSTCCMTGIGERTHSKCQHSALDQYEWRIWWFVI